MKKILTILIATLLIGTTAFAQESEITVEKGQYLQVGSAEENIEVNIYNELDTNLIWEDVETENIDGVANVLIPSDNPLKTVHVHIVKGDEENVLKVHLVEPHEHQGHYVDAVRPTDTEAGSKPYFVCDCGKYFEDKACTIEITEDINTWKYLAPIPKEQWGEGNPVPYVEEIDGNNITDPEKPNPTWTEEQVTEYYEQEETKIQEELEERKTSQNEESELVVENDVIETNEVIEPVTFAVQPVEEEEPTLWEQIKMFFVNLFK